jgi:hypothetical protein
VRCGMLRRDRAGLTISPRAYFRATFVHLELRRAASLSSYAKPNKQVRVFGATTFDGFEPEGREFESLRARHFPLTCHCVSCLLPPASLMMVTRLVSKLDSIRSLIPRQRKRTPLRLPRQLASGPICPVVHGRVRYTLLREPSGDPSRHVIVSRLGPEEPEREDPETAKHRSI